MTLTDEQIRQQFFKDFPLAKENLEKGKYTKEDFYLDLKYYADGFKAALSLQGEAAKVVPLQEINDLLNKEMDICIKNGANSISMPDELVAISHFINFPEQYGFIPMQGEAVPVAFQERVAPWMQQCFGSEISCDTVERNYRFLEESLELVQACGCTQYEAHQLVDYVYGRPVGEPYQEVGGVMITLAALCLAQQLDMHEAGETELARILQPEIIEKIRSKQAGKPKHSPLPEHSPPLPTAQQSELIRIVRSLMADALPDPHDERGLSADWLANKIIDKGKAILALLPEERKE